MVVKHVAARKNNGTEHLLVHIAAKKLALETKGDDDHGAAAADDDDCILLMLTPLIIITNH